jgi:hypothetical protein
MPTVYKGGTPVRVPDGQFAILAALVTLGEAHGPAICHATHGQCLVASVYTQLGRLEKRGLVQKREVLVPLGDHAAAARRVVYRLVDGVRVGGAAPPIQPTVETVVNDEASDHSLPTDLSEAKRLVTQLRARVQDLTLERDTAMHGCRIASDNCVRLEGLLLEARNANDDVHGTLSRLSGLLKDVTDALKGAPPPLTLYSWHDLPEWAAAAAGVANAALALGAPVPDSTQVFRAMLDATSAWRALTAKQIMQDAEHAVLAASTDPQRGEHG